MLKYQHEFDRWFENDGDQKHLLNHKLNSNSIVIDAGGFIGDFAFDISSKFGSKVFVFEPIDSYFESIVQRFNSRSNVKVFNFGISSCDKELEITINGDASSFHSSCVDKPKKICKIRDVDNVLTELGIKNIDLFKINIEGDEFELIEKLISTDVINNINFLQVQFHDFIPDSEKRRDEIRSMLKTTHNCDFEYKFVWEGWRKR